MLHSTNRASCDRRRKKKKKKIYKVSLSHARSIPMNLINTKVFLFFYFLDVLC